MPIKDHHQWDASMLNNERRVDPHMGCCCLHVQIPLQFLPIYLNHIILILYRILNASTYTINSTLHCTVVFVFKKDWTSQLRTIERRCGIHPRCITQSPDYLKHLNNEIIIFACIGAGRAGSRYDAFWSTSPGATLEGTLF